MGQSSRLLAQGRRSIGLQVLIKVLLDAGFFMHAVTHSSFNMAGVVMVQYGLMGSSSLFGMMLSVLGNALKIALFYFII